MLKLPEFMEVSLGEIHSWKDNPRNITNEDLEELAKSITEKGQFENLVCWKEDDGRLVTGGGNMRLLAMKQILKWPSDKKVQISLNFPENKQEKIELAFLSNMRFGQNDEQKIAELTLPFVETLDIETLKIDIYKPVQLKQIIETFAPDRDGGEGNIPQLLTCPECGANFNYKDAKKEQG